MTLPRSLTFSAYHEFNENVAILGDADWTDWSAFDRTVIRIDATNPIEIDSLPSILAGHISFLPRPSMVDLPIAILPHCSASESLCFRDSLPCGTMENFS